MPARVRTMNVSITPKLCDFVESLVKSGRYGSASEVMREGLRLMHEREAKLRWLRREVDKGIRQLDRGEGIPAEQVFRELRRIVRRSRRKSA